MKNYISLYHDRRRRKVLAWESLGSPRVRTRREFDEKFYFYVPDRLGDHVALTGERLKKLEFSSQEDYDQAIMACPTRFESDFEVIERTFQEEYAGLHAPELVVGFFDIEIDYDPVIGFAGPKNPYAPINAVTVIKSTGGRATLAVPPKSLAGVSLTALTAELEKSPTLQGLTLFATEKELLASLLDLIHDVDALSGWNSEFFDVPYIGKRIELVLGEEHLARLSFEGGPPPRWTEKARFKGARELEAVLDLVTRVHLDYMLLFKKFNLKTRQSFSLDAVCLEELGESKLEYEGTLAELYQQDFQKFLEYNVHDSELLVRLERQFKYIETANLMVHEATVNFRHIFGSVQLIDSAIINYAHKTLGKIVNDRVDRPDGPPVEGAIVMTPRPGLFKHVGAVDINSLYPSTIRSLNLSPEKIVGQLQAYEEGWELFHRGMSGDDSVLKEELVIRLDGADEELILEVGDFITVCLEKRYAVSAYGTILDQSSGPGVLPSILGYWFNGRKEMQAEKKRQAKLAESILQGGVKLSKSELALLSE